MKLSTELLKVFMFKCLSVLARLALTALGTTLINKGLVTGGQWDSVLTGLAIVVTGIVWSAVEKYNLLKYIGAALEAAPDTSFKELKEGK